MKKVAFVTSSTSPEISLDDSILLEALEANNLRGIAAPWDDLTVAWHAFDLLLIRSCWNYHLDPAKFRTWIESMMAAKIRMLNPAELILWNMNKCYLKELQEKGASIPDSVWISEEDFYEDKLLDILAERKWSRAVLKPCISASSFNTKVITPVTAKEDGKKLFENFKKGGMILQEFVEAIPKQGEISIIFLNGEYSHSVIKQAMPGDFRVQHQFGGTCQTITVDEAIIASAAKILAKLPVVPLYARVDGFEKDGRFNLMELELIEPVLFFKYVPAAAKRLALEIGKLV